MTVMSFQGLVLVTFRNFIQSSSVVVGVAAMCCDALHNLVPFVQFKNVKNIIGGVLLSGSLQPY